MQLARDLRQRVLDGEPFGDLAATYSDCPSGADGGDLGPFLPGDMDATFEEALAALAVGELSEPVRTGHGVHLIRRDEP
jgi:parvulin-like peptidyl-prolyl isomerase